MAEDLDVADVVPASLGHWNDVIVMQIVLGSTLDTASLITLPNKLLDLRRDATTAAFSRFSFLDAYSAKAIKT